MLPGKGTSSTLHKGIICARVAWSPDIFSGDPHPEAAMVLEVPIPKCSPQAEAGKNLNFPLWASPGWISRKNGGRGKPALEVRGSLTVLRTPGDRITQQTFAKSPGPVP